MKTSSAPVLDKGRVERVPHSAWIRFLHLTSLTGLAVAQPLYGLLSDAPEFFGAHRSGPKEVLLLVFASSLAIPITVTAVSALFGWFSNKAAAAFHLLAVTLLSGLLVLGALRNIESVGAWPILASALVAGACFSFLYLRYSRLRSFVTFLSVSALVFAGLFLFRPPVSTLLFASPAESELVVRSNSKTPIVLIVFDELPLSSLMRTEGSINELLYPRFAELAGTADWFPNATTVSHSTNESLPAILTGRYPEGERPSSLRNSLFSIAASSHELVVYQELFSHCPADLCDDPLAQLPTSTKLRRLSSDISVMYQHLYRPASSRGSLPPIDQGWADFSGHLTDGREAHERIAFMRRFVDSIDSNDQPALYFLHPNFPHSPWRHLPTGRQYGPLTIPVSALGLSDYRWNSEEHYAMQGWQRHLLQVGFADRLLGEAIDKMKAEEIFDEALIVVTADHGASFVPEGNYRAPENLQTAPDILMVPLLIKEPHQTHGRIRQEGVETIDILPTIADVLGVSLPWEAQGLSIRDPETVESAVADRPPSPVQYPRGTLQVEATVARKEAVFGNDPDGLFAYGPIKHLIGRSADELGWEPSIHIEAVLEGESDYERVEPGSDYIPAFVVGWLESSSPLPLDADLAIAVNGTIRAGAKVGAASEERARFAALVPEESFTSGHNRVDVFIVERNSGETTLVRAARPRPQTYFLRDDRIETSDGASWAFGTSSLRGAVEQKGVQLVGWAADRKRLVPAERVLFFVDGEFVLSVRLLRATPRLNKLHGDKLSRAGFRFATPYSRIPEGSQVRLFAIAGDSAAELRYGKSFRLNGTDSGG